MQICFFLVFKYEAQWSLTMHSARISHPVLGVLPCFKLKEIISPWHSAELSSCFYDRWYALHKKKNGYALEFCSCDLSSCKVKHLKNEGVPPHTEFQFTWDFLRAEKGRFVQTRALFQFWSGKLQNVLMPCTEFEVYHSRKGTASQVKLLPPNGGNNFKGIDLHYPVPPSGSAATDTQLHKLSLTGHCMGPGLSQTVSPGQVFKCTLVPSWIFKQTLARTGLSCSGRGWALAWQCRVQSGPPCFNRPKMEKFPAMT